MICRGYKLSLKSISAFKVRLQAARADTYTLPPCTGEAAARKETSCGRARQSWPKQRSQHGKEALCHIPLGPERLLASTLDLGDLPLLPKGTAGEGCCCPGWAAVRVSHSSEAAFDCSPSARKPGAMGSPAPLPARCNDFGDFLADYLPALGQKEETAARAADDGERGHTRGVAGCREG